MNAKNSDKLIVAIRWVLITAAFLGAYFLGRHLLGDDQKELIKWSVALIMMGLAFLPLTGLIFDKFHDGGWLFAKVMGLAISGWLTWYLASEPFKIMKFTEANCVVILGVCAAINYIAYAAWKYVLYARAKRLDAKGIVTIHAVLPAFDEKKLFSAVTTELLFLLAFVFWCYIKGYKPEAYGSTEKFTDLGIMTAILRADYMPAEDVWFSGESINYYYLGQYMIVYITRIARTTVYYGYNLGLMMLAAFCMTLPYTIVYNLVKNADIPVLVQWATKNAKKLINRFRLSSFCGACGVLAGLAVTITASMHYPLYKHILPYLAGLRGEEMDNSYWFPNPTRYIGHNPETSDKTIHEFPSYSFILGDLHAHVINIMFVMTVLGILFAFLLYRRKKMLDVRDRAAMDDVVIKDHLFHPAILVVSFFVGLFQTTNFWDFPIYFVVSGAIILFSNAVICRFKLKDTMIMTGLHAVIVLVIGQLVALPFTISFKSITKGINIPPSNTPLYQLLVLWALPVICLVIYIIYHYNFLRQNQRIVNVKLIQRKNSRKRKHINAKPDEKEVKSYLLQFIRELNVSDLFAITIGLCAFGLVIIPELIYVVDIYSGDYKRANTMFKLTYQAYIMFGIAMSFMIPRLLLSARKTWYKVVATIMLVCLIWTTGYLGEAFYDWFGIGDKGRDTGYITLDSAAFLKNEFYEDYLAINWLNENVKGVSVVLEANGYAYTYYQRVSTITGLPTVLGWETQEWLWRSYESEFLEMPPSQIERRDDIETIYTSDSYDEVKALLKKYDVGYIYVGGLEREKFTNINEDMLKSMGSIVYEVPAYEVSDDWGDAYMVEGDTYIIKVE